MQSKAIFSYRHTFEEIENVVQTLVVHKAFSKTVIIVDLDLGVFSESNSYSV